MYTAHLANQAGLRAPAEKIMLDDLNKSLFLLINAKEGDADVVRLAAVFLAQYLTGWWGWA